MDILDTAGQVRGALPPSAPTAVQSRASRRARLNLASLLPSAPTGGLRCHSRQLLSHRRGASRRSAASPATPPPSVPPCLAQPVPPSTARAFCASSPSRSALPLST